METISYFDVEISPLRSYYEPRAFPVRHQGCWLQLIVKKLTTKKSRQFLIVINFIHLAYY